MTGLWQVLANSVEGCPSPLRQLLACVHAVVSSRFGAAGDSDVPGQAVGGLFFLRFICPALLQPQLHGVTDEAPSEPTNRTLTLLGKTLINLANLCEFGRKESFMAEMNHAFIRPSLQVMPAPHDPFLPPLTTLFLHPCLISSAPRCRALATFSTCSARALRATDRGRMRSSSATGARSTSPRWIDG